MKQKLLKIVLPVAAAIMLFVTVEGKAHAQAEPFIGQLAYVGFNFAPRGWAQCDGQVIAISQNTALFSLLGTEFGGDGRTTFALPDMRGRVPIHQGTGPGLSTFRIGMKGGVELASLTVLQLPAHTHTATAVSGSTSTVADGATASSTLKANSGIADKLSPDGNVLAQSAQGNGARAVDVNTYNSTTPDVDMHAGSIVTTLSGVAITTTTTTDVTVSTTGGSQSFPIMQPYTVLNCVIALQGIFPSRS